MISFGARFQLIKLHGTPDIVKSTIMALSLPSVISFEFTDYVVFGDKHKDKCRLCRNKNDYLVEKKGTTSSFTR